MRAGPTFIGADLGDGVIVRRIDTEHNHYNRSITVNVELELTDMHPDIGVMMRKLSDLFSVNVPLTGSPFPHIVHSNGGQPDVSELTNDGEEDFETMVARRFDEIDQALRLLVDP